MQVIAGKYKGRKLKSLDEKSTRPTLQRVKQSMFDIIQDNIDGRVVLDLFAGSGALGIEALSRGAKEVYFVENNPSAISVINENLKKVSEPYRVLNLDFMAALKKLKAENVKLDLVFLDPPYSTDYIEKIFEFLSKNEMLSRGAIIVVENDSKKCLQNEYYECIMITTRSYGLMKVSVYEHSED